MGATDKGKYSSKGKGHFKSKNHKVAKPGSTPAVQSVIATEGAKLTKQQKRDLKRNQKAQNRSVSVCSETIEFNAERTTAKSVYKRFGI